MHTTNPNTTIRIRTATIDDASAMAHHRAEMFHDMGLVTRAHVPALEAGSLDYLRGVLASGEYLGWLAERSGEIVAGGGLLIRALLPRPGLPAGGTEAYLLNVYTEPEARRIGLARAIVEQMLAWCRERHVQWVSLHASDEGRPLYEHLGFQSTNEMRIEQLDV